MIPSYRSGDTIGPYRILQFLGRGSFGAVVLVQPSGEPSLQRYALKLVPCDHLEEDSALKAKDQAIAEAELLQKLRHPNIVTCHQVCYDPMRKVVWFALDFMDGGDLQTVIKARLRAREPPFETEFLRRVLYTLAGALSYVHAQGVLHRDVKPANVLLTKGVEEMKLTDFGIAKLLETGHAHTLLGSPAYMSPEIVCGRPYGSPADAWACGALLYELASLRRPFEASNQLALVWQIVETQPAGLPLTTDPDIAAAISGLLIKDPEQRLRFEDIELQVPDATMPMQSSFAVHPSAPAELDDSWNWQEASVQDKDIISEQSLQAFGSSDGYHCETPRSLLAREVQASVASAKPSLSDHPGDHSAENSRSHSRQESGPSTPRGRYSPRGLGISIGGFSRPSSSVQSTPRGFSRGRLGEELAAAASSDVPQPFDEVEVVEGTVSEEELEDMAPPQRAQDMAQPGGDLFPPASPRFFAASLASPRSAGSRGWLSRLGMGLLRRNEEQTTAVSAFKGVTEEAQ